MEIPDDIKKLICSVVFSVPNGIPLKFFFKAYEDLVNEPLNIEKLGYKNIIDLLNKLPDVVKIKLINGEKRVFGIASNSLAYINPTAASSEWFALQNEFSTASNTYNSIDKADIYIGNLPLDTTKDEIKNHFKNYRICNLRIFNRDERVYAFFECDFSIAHDVINNMYLKKFKNRNIFIEFSKQCNSIQDILLETSKIQISDNTLELNDLKSSHQNIGQIPFLEANSTKKNGIVKKYCSVNSTLPKSQCSSENEEEIFKYCLQENDLSTYNMQNLSNLNDNKNQNLKNINDDHFIYSNADVNNGYHNLDKSNYYKKHLNDNKLIEHKANKNSPSPSIEHFLDRTSNLMKNTYSTKKDILNSKEDLFITFDKNLCYSDPKIEINDSIYNSLLDKKLIMNKILKRFIQIICLRKINLSTTRDEFRKSTNIYNHMDAIMFSGLVSESPLINNKYPGEFPLSMHPNILNMITEDIFNQNDEENILLPDTMIVLVTSIECTSQYFWAIIILPIIEKNSYRFVEMHKELQVTAAQFLPDDFMSPKAAIFINNIWCRVWVKVRFTHHVVVFLIDYGLTLLVKYNEVYSIPEELWNYKAMALPFKSYVILLIKY